MGSPFDLLQHQLNTAVLDVFGSSVLIDGQARQAEYREAGQEVSLGEVSAVANVPHLLMHDNDVPDRPVGRAVIVGALRYRVADAIKDGHGMTVLYLETTR